jgi:hypothetical protein
MPALHVTFLAIALVSVLYTLVPEGRWRNTGKWVVTALVTLTAIGRMALGADGPADVLVGVALGVTIPLLTYRWFAPNEAFPITYRRGSGAHLDVGGARGQAIRRGLEAQLGLEVTELRITVAGAPRPSCSASCTPRATCARTAGTSWAGSCCTAASRTRSPSTPSGGWSSRTTTRCR